MLLRSQVKGPITLLLILSLISFVCLIGGIIISALWKYIGFMMQTSTFSGCSAYLTLKLESANTYIYNIIFICSCISAIILIAIVVYLIMLLLKYANGSNGQQDQSRQFPQFSLTSFCLLYVLYCCGILAAIPGAGYYLTLIIEKGYNCTSTFIIDWLIIGGLFVLALLILLACWIYLFIFKLKVQEKFEEKPIVVQKPIKQPQRQPTMKEALEQMLLLQRLRKDQQSVKQIKEPLLSQVDEEDRVEEQDQKQKIAFVGFDQYKKRQELIKQKEKEEQEMFNQFIVQEMFRRAHAQRQKEQEQQKRQQEKNKKLQSQALSPNDQNFDKIFEESERQDKENDKNNKSKQISNPNDTPKQQQLFYPANYVPIDEQDQKKYKAYKKRILQQLKPKHHVNRHPQNIQGGRSRKKLEAFIRRHKKPQRNEETYKKKNQNSSTPIETSILKLSNDNESQEDDDQSANFNSPQQKKQQKPLAISIFSPDQKLEESDYQKQHEETVHKVIQIKQRTKSPMRKKLFQETQKVFNYQTAASILGNLFKGVVKANKIQQRNQRKRNQQEKNDPRSQKKKSEKLIDSIRSKFT